MKPLVHAIGAILALGLLIGCSSPEDESNLHTRCNGDDKVFILDDPNQGSDIVVIPDHADCVGKADR